MAKTIENLNSGELVAEKADFDLNQSGQPTAQYVSNLFTSANTSLVAVCREYGGTQIKQDENGNFYYEVEVED